MRVETPARSRTIDGACADDRELVLALRTGDAVAPSLLIERFGDVVFGLCLRMMGHRQDAEDVVQDTFLRAFRGVRGFDPDRPLRPWLLGIAANRCRTALSKRKRRPMDAEALEVVPDHREPFDGAQELARAVEVALQGLREDYRLVFVLYHQQGLPYEEIAEALGRPIGTIRTWLHRARADLARSLRRAGYRPEG